jgi:hypothetical protein
LVLSASDVNELIIEFNNKLPFTKDYYKLGDYSEVFTDAGFLKSLNDKSGINNDVLSLQLLMNLTGEKDELFKRLLKHELDSKKEREVNNG